MRRIGFWLVALVAFLGFALSSCSDSPTRPPCDPTAPDSCRHGWPR